MKTKFEEFLNEDIKSIVRKAKTPQEALDMFYGELGAEALVNKNKTLLDWAVQNGADIKSRTSRMLPNLIWRGDLATLQFGVENDYIDVKKVPDSIIGRYMVWTRNVGTKSCAEYLVDKGCKVGKNSIFYIIKDDLSKGGIHKVLLDKISKLDPKNKIYIADAYLCKCKKSKYDNSLNTVDFDKLFTHYVNKENIDVNKLTLTNYGAQYDDDMVKFLLSKKMRPKKLFDVLIKSPDKFLTTGKSELLQNKYLDDVLKKNPAIYKQIENNLTSEQKKKYDFYAKVNDFGMLDID